VVEETEGQDTDAAGAEPVAAGTVINRASSAVDEELKAYRCDQRRHLKLSASLVRCQAVALMALESHR
jgi:hypothetical protein